MSGCTHDRHARFLNLGMKLFLLPDYYAFRKRVVRLLDLTPGNLLLDFGCGVGLLEDLLIRGKNGPLRIIGVDIGRELLKTAGKRLGKAAPVDFCAIGASGNLPFADETFDRVVMNLVSHLLDPAQKNRVFRELFRVLKPNGRAVFAEIGRPYNLQGRWFEFLSTTLWKKVYSYEENAEENLRGCIPEYLIKAGFAEIQKVGQTKGFIEFLVGKKDIRSP